MSLLDWLTVFSYVALTADVVFEAKRIYRTKSSDDLSLFGMLIRFMALSVLMVKFIQLHDRALIIGQAIVAVTFAAYFLLAIFYFRHKPVKKRKK